MISKVSVLASRGLQPSRTVAVCVAFFGIPPTDRSPDREHVVETHDIVPAELNFERGDIFFDVPSPLAARNRDDVVALCEQPRKRQLRWRAVLFRGHGTQ